LPLLLVSALALAGCETTGLIRAPMPEALAALQPDARVQVETEPWLIFRPADEEPAVGLVFYPGLWVDHRSYAPPARAIAAQGYLVVITPMPLDLAVLAPDRAAEVMAAFPAVRCWAVGGHSLGGGVAAHFAHTHPATVRGLVLWASFPSPIADLSARQDLAVVSIYGTRDSLTTSEQIAASRRLLPPPPATRWVSIEGGNHAQFGWYGDQWGDTAATISREAQQEQVIAATLGLLALLGEQGP